MKDCDLQRQMIVYKAFVVSLIKKYKISYISPHRGKAQSTTETNISEKKKLTKKNIHKVIAQMYRYKTLMLYIRPSDTALKSLHFDRGQLVLIFLIF